MAKVMLVEDDNNLREIYEARLAAEGYQIVSAPDGEAALALAIKEKPDLIISDIMMPKVSGFDMLDILRSTTETKNAKIIMMTALGQAEDKARAEKLGADRYLVKSQVTLEDVVKAAQELLGNQNPTEVGGVPVEQPTATTPTTPTTTTPLVGDTPTAAVPAAPVATPTPQPAPVPAAAAEPVVPPLTSTPPAPAPAQPTSPQPSTPTPAPVASPAPAVTAPTPQSIPVTIAPDTPPAPAPEAAPAAPVAPPEPVSAMAAAPSDGDKTLETAATTLSPEDKPSGEQVIVKSDAPSTAPVVPDQTPAGQRKKIINPISDVLGKGPDLNALLAKEGETLDDPEFSSGPSEQTPPAPEAAPTAPVAEPEPVIAPPPAQSTPTTSAAEPTIPDTSTTAEEEAALQDKIEQFITTQNPSISTSPTPTAPISDVKPPDAPAPTA